jgi:hypothetical protein
MLNTGWLSYQDNLFCFKLPNIHHVGEVLKHLFSLQLKH